MKYQVIEEHHCNNPKPLAIQKGATVKLGERSDEVENWPNWIYCYTLDGTSEGWTPVQLIEIDGEYGTVLEDYSAKELVVEKDELVEGSIEMNGWIWCNKINESEMGWLPKEKMAIYII